MARFANVMSKLGFGIKRVLSVSTKTGQDGMQEVGTPRFLQFTLLHMYFEFLSCVKYRDENISIKYANRFANIVVLNDIKVTDNCAECQNKFVVFQLVSEILV